MPAEGIVSAVQQATDSPRSPGTPVILVIAPSPGSELVERVRRALPEAQVAGCSHDGALGQVPWGSVDAVVIDPVDRARRDDQIPGARVVEHLRSISGRRAPAVLVVGPGGADGAVRRRMREAGADGYVDLGEVDDVSLARAVGSPTFGAAGEHEASGVLAHLGVTDRSQVNEGVRAALQERLVPEATWIGPKGADRSARLERFNRFARLQPMGAEGPVPGDAPSLAQIQRFVRWATRVEGPPGVPSFDVPSIGGSRATILTST